MFYSVCVPAVFSGMPPHEALAKVKEAGIPAYEIWAWWNLDVDALLAAQKENGLRIAALCTKFEPLTDPACRDAYVAGLKETIAVAKKLGCATIISQVGQERPGVPRQAQHQSIVDGLKVCAPLLEDAGVTLVIEPLNTLINHQGYYLYASQEAFDIVDEVGSAKVKVLYDVYHQQIMEGNLINNMTANVEKIGHVHTAGHPGRHELLGESEINYAAVLGALKKAGYQLAVGLEYFPVEDTMTGLARLTKEIPL